MGGESINNQLDELLSKKKFFENKITFLNEQYNDINNKIEEYEKLKKYVKKYKVRKKIQRVICTILNVATIIPLGLFFIRYTDNNIVVNVFQAVTASVVIVTPWGIKRIINETFYRNDKKCVSKLKTLEGKIKIEELNNEKTNILTDIKLNKRNNEENDIKIEKVQNEKKMNEKKLSEKELKENEMMNQFYSQIPVQLDVDAEMKKLLQRRK